MNTIIEPSVKYTDSHEWVKIDKNIATVGISDHAQSLLGDLVYVELPSIGTTFQKGEEAGVVESVKAASDLYVPISGEVIEINHALENQPELINQSPYDKGWLYRIKVSDITEMTTLLSPEDYKVGVQNHA